MAHVLVCDQSRSLVLNIWRGGPVEKVTGDPITGRS